jgi:hypothetical protein
VISSIKFNQNILHKKYVKLSYTSGFSSSGARYRIDTQRFAEKLVTEIHRLAQSLLQMTGFLHVAMREGHTWAPADESRPVRHTSDRVLQIK